jgi:hypothetical protein
MEKETLKKDPFSGWQHAFLAVTIFFNVDLVSRTLVYLPVLCNNVPVPGLALLI